MSTFHKITDLQIALARFAMFAILLGGLAVTMAEPVRALADPDVISIEQVRRYTNVEISGDALYVVHYNLEYTVPPAESITQGWIGRVLDVGVGDRPGLPSSVIVSVPVGTGATAK